MSNCLRPDDPLGYQFMGTINVTETGRTCQRWDSQTPHKYVGLEFFLIKGGGHRETKWGEDPSAFQGFCMQI